MKGGSIRTMDRLEREIRRRKVRAAEIERALDDNVGHLRENFRGMAVNSVFGSRRTSGREIAGELTLRLLESEKLQDNLLSLVDKLTERISKAVRRTRSSKSDM